MKQLTGLDVSFLLMETPNTYGHVNGLSIYERPSADFDPFAEVRNRLSIMVGHLEPLRRKVVEVPFELDRPYWIEDADFDIDFHVRHIGLAPPGAADQLAEQVARIVGRKMDRSRPLWEAYVIEGLADGRWALLQKTHHATIDGASGVIMLKMFTDDSPDAIYPLEHREWVGEEPPSRSDMLQTAAKNLAINPIRQVRLSLNVVRDFADAAGITSVSGIATQARSTLGAIARRSDPTSDRSNERVSLPLTSAPPTPWNASVTPDRRFAMRSTSLENLKRSRTPPAARSTMWSWPFVPVRCAPTSSKTMHYLMCRFEQWCPCRFEPATKKTRGPTASRPSLPTSRRTAQTRSSE